ncbi:MAG: hypothetical protein V3V22_10865, partial [Methylococcales bacterium]
MNILNTLKERFDSIRLNQHSSPSSTPEQTGDGQTIPSSEQQTDSHSNSNDLFISKSGIDKLSASAKKSFHQQTEQLKTVSTDLGKNLTHQSNEAINSLFTSAKSALAKQT